MEQNVICGNNIELLKSYPDNHFDAIVTDPPYGLGKEPNAEDMLREWLKSGYMEVKGGGFMGKEWDAFVPQPIFWKEVFRVLKPGGYVLAFYGTRTYDWGVMAMRLAGFEVRDCVQWIYGSGFPKSHNIGKAVDKLQGNEREDLGRNPAARPSSDKGDYETNTKWKTPPRPNITKGKSEWEGWGSALKPAVEPIVVCRKPLEKGLSIAENVLKWGVGGINIDGCRVGFKNEADYLESTKKNQHEDFGTKPMTNNNVYGDYSMIQPKNYQPEGRFPANIILECICDEVIKGERGEIIEHNGSGGIWNEGTKEPVGRTYNDKGDTHTNPDCPCYIMDRQSGGNASRFFYQAKASKSERNRGLEGFEVKQTKGGGGGIGDYLEDVNAASGKFGSEKAPSSNFHPTVKPVKLMQYLVRLVTPPNGLVLDPFCGSGTTGIACRLEGFNFVGMEREEDYAKIAQARIDNWFGASDKDSVSESSSLVESASAEDSASARLEPPKEIHTQLKFNF